MIPKYQHALIVGAGPGLSASLARVFAAQGLRVTMAARTVEDLEPLCLEIGATRCAGGCAEAVRGGVARALRLIFR